MDHLENLILREDLARILLVGHSYGGAVIHGLEARLVDRIRAVVHLEGAIPAPDASVVDGWRADYRQEVLALAAANGGWRVPPPGPAMWIGLSAEQQRWLRSQLTAQALKTFQDTMPADLARSDRPHYYLWAKDRPTHPYQAVVERFRDQEDWAVIATTGGHEPPLTNPQAVLQVIDAAIRHERLPSEI